MLSWRFGRFPYFILHIEQKSFFAIVLSIVRAIVVLDALHDQLLPDQWRQVSVVERPQVLIDFFHWLIDSLNCNGRGFLMPVLMSVLMSAMLTAQETTGFTHEP